MNKIFYFIGLMPLLTGCFGPKHLQTKLNREQYPLGYLHDSPIISEKIDVSISPSFLDKSDTTYLTYVKKDDGHLLYLVFMYDYNYDYTISLGKNSINPGLSDFIINSFIKESERSGIYCINDMSKIKKYRLQIELLDYNINSKYHTEGDAFGGYQEWHIDVRPSNGNLKLKATLYDFEKNEIFSKIYNSYETTTFVKSRVNSENEINRNMMQNMAETLAQCIKKAISNMVSDINSKIK